MTKSSLVNWVEPGVLIISILTSAVAVSAVTLYRLDSLETKVDRLISNVVMIKVLKQEVKELKAREGETLRIFEKFSDSVNQLAISVAQIGTKVDYLEVDNAKER